MASIVSRETVLESGTAYLQSIGSDHICKVCISSGGSCCIGCQHLSNGIGCQLRNTSCTAWLCGFLKYLLYEMELLQQWNDFWDQVPGQAYRQDTTPAFIIVDQLLSPYDIQPLSAALAADLQELERSHIAIGFIITLREKIDKNIDRLSECNPNSTKQLAKIKRKIKILSRPFYRFHKELRELPRKSLLT